MNLFGNGGGESTVGGPVGGQVGIALDGLVVFGAFEGFAVDGFRVGGLFLVGVNVGRLSTVLGVGFLLFGSFVGSSVRPRAKGASVGRELGEAGTEGTKVGEGEGIGWRAGFAVGSSVGRAIGKSVAINTGVNVISTLGRGVCSTVG